MTHYSLYHLPFLLVLFLFLYLAPLLLVVVPVHQVSRLVYPIHLVPLACSDPLVCLILLIVRPVRPMHFGSLLLHVLLVDHYIPPDVVLCTPVVVYAAVSHETW